ncbi:hypothetical protein BT69DRAFT_1343387 [Atractiella rhizophila]|nr:hypothetical protein BT69DRAFT_1343387 [Atractiella rhizophila]
MSSYILFLASVFCFLCTAFGSARVEQNKLELQHTTQLQQLQQQQQAQIRTLEETHAENNTLKAKIRQVETIPEDAPMEEDEVSAPLSPTVLHSTTSISVIPVAERRRVFRSELVPTATSLNQQHQQQPSDSVARSAGLIQNSEAAREGFPGRGNQSPSSRKKSPRRSPPKKSPPIG